MMTSAVIAGPLGQMYGPSKLEKLRSGSIRKRQPVALFSGSGERPAQILPPRLHLASLKRFSDSCGSGRTAKVRLLKLKSKK